MKEELPISRPRAAPEEVQQRSGPSPEERMNMMTEQFGQRMEAEIGSLRRRNIELEVQLGMAVQELAVYRAQGEQG